jgi:transposase-like protein
MTIKFCDICGKSNSTSEIKRYSHTADNRGFNIHQRPLDFCQDCHYKFCKYLKLIGSRWSLTPQLDL